MKTSIEHIAHKNNTVTLAKFAKALAHPTRLAILQHLENQSCCFTGDLVDVFPIAQSTVSQHPKKLKNASLIPGELKPPRIMNCINHENWNRAKQLFQDFLLNFFPIINVSNGEKTKQINDQSN